MSKFSTGVKEIDKMLEGGILLGAPALIFGIPNLGNGERVLSRSLIEEVDLLSA